jgi:cell division protein FtsZ
MLADLGPLHAPARPFRLLVAGVGGAGCRALRVLVGLPADVVAIHTDAQALGASGAPRLLQLGAARLHGAGTGGEPALGEAAALAEAEILRALFRDYELVWFIGGLGGGTASGALPVLARLAREASALTFVLATLPFAFEGDQRRQHADAALERLRQHADALAEAPNDRLLAATTGAPPTLARAFTEADAALGLAIPTLLRLLSGDSLLRLDFADLRRFLQRAGRGLRLAAFRLPLAELRTRVREEVLVSPLLDAGHALARARALLLAVVGGADLPLADLDWLARELRDACLSPPAHFRVTAAASPEPAADGHLQLCLLVGAEWREADPEPLAPPAAAEPPSRESPPSAVGEASAAGPAVQIEIPLPTPDLQGKFADTEANTVGGADLDIPTFIRRGLRIKHL